MPIPAPPAAWFVTRRQARSENAECLRRAALYRRWGYYAFAREWLHNARLWRTRDDFHIA